MTGTIGSEGGSLAVKLAGDIIVTLVFPAGAVFEPVDITLRPVTPIGEALFGLSLEPAGIVFAEPVDVAAEFPAGIDLTNEHLAWGDPADLFVLGTGLEPGSSTLTTTVNYFGLTDEILETPDKAAPGANQLGTAPATCKQLVAALKRRFDLFLSLNKFEDAVRVAEVIADRLLANQCADWTDWVDILKQTACDGAAAAIVDAQSTPINHYGDFFDQLKPLLSWMKIIAELPNPVPCSPDFMGTIGAKLLEYTNFANPIINGLQAFDFATFLDLKFEARRLFQLWAISQMFGLSDPADVLMDDALLPAMNIMRQTAYQLAYQDDWYYPLSRITTEGFFANRDIVGVTPVFLGTAPSSFFNYSNDDIYEDLQYSSMDVLLESIVASGGTLDDDRVGGDGVPGQFKAQAQMDAPTRGRLSLQGKLNGFTCWDDTHFDSEIVFRMNATDVFTLPRVQGSDDYFQGGHAELNIDSITQAAGIIPKEGGFSVITAVRRGGNCNQDVWGPPEYTLFTWILDWKNPTLEVAVDLPANVEPGETVDVDVRVKVKDQLDQVGFFAGIDLVLQSDGGTLNALNGTTDAQGYFQTQMTVDASSLIIDGKTGKAMLGASVTASATSFEGVTAQGTGTAIVGEPGHAEAVWRRLSLYASASTVGGFDEQAGGQEDDAPFGNFQNGVSAASSGTDDQGHQVSAEASADLAVNYVYDSPSVMSKFSGSGTTSSSVTGEGSAHAVAQNSLLVTVIGEPISYNFSGSLSGLKPGAALDRRKIEGGWELPKIFETRDSSFSTAGVLGLGSYRIKLDAVSDANSGAGSFNFTFEINPPPAAP